MTVSRNPMCLFFAVALLFLTLTAVLREWHVGLKEEKKPFGDAARPDGLTSVSSRLLQQLMERQHELELLGIPVDNLQSAQGLMHPRLFINDSGEETLTDHIGCEDLRSIQTVDFLGSGYTKTVVKAVLPRGRSVALKSVNVQGSDMRTCLEDFKDFQGCHELISFKLRKEVVLLQTLKHPNIVEFKGQCQASALVGGITAVLEQGMPLQMIHLLQSPWEDRFRICLGLMRLLQYLSHTPLGSVALLDFQPRQFVTVSGELKLTDLDDAIVMEPRCQEDSDCLLQFPLRNFTLRCSPSNICKGLNEMRNLYNAYRYFFTYLLPHQAPALLRPFIQQIMNSTGDLKQSVSETLDAFEEVLKAYRSGLHLEDVPPSITRDYALVKGMKSVADVGYRCWPSYEPLGCVLSVHGPREAMHICNQHAKCTSFSLSDRTTWTGRRLASFRSGFSHLVPDVNASVYMRRAKAAGAALRETEPWGKGNAPDK